MLRRFLIAAFLLVGGCGPSHVVLTEGSCVSPKIGDTVEGSATFHSYAGTGCIECGSYLTQKGCDVRIGFRTATREADQAYDEITQRSGGEPSFGPIERQVLVTGAVIPSGATGKPLLNAISISEIQRR